MKSLIYYEPVTNMLCEVVPVRSLPYNEVYCTDVCEVRGYIISNEDLEDILIYIGEL